MPVLVNCKYSLLQGPLGGGMAACSGAQGAGQGLLLWHIAHGHRAMGQLGEGCWLGDLPWCAWVVPN